jgi:hypothetical protein
VDRVHYRADDPAPPERQPVDATTLEPAFDEAGVRRVLAAEIEVDEVDPVVILARLEAGAVERRELGQQDRAIGMRATRGLGDGWGLPCYAMRNAGRIR